MTRKGLVATRGIASQICEEIVRITTTGSDGSATGNASSQKVRGFLLDIYLDYHASAPATTDVTVSHESPSKGNLLVVADNATDGLYAPRAKPVDNANAAITNAHDKFPLNGQVKITVAGCNALTNAVVAYIRYLSA